MLEDSGTGCCNAQPISLRRSPAAGFNGDILQTLLEIVKSHHLVEGNIITKQTVLKHTYSMPQITYLHDFPTPYLAVAAFVRSKIVVTAIG